MALNLVQLLTLFNVPKIGEITLRSLKNYASSQNITLSNNAYELHSFLKHCKQAKVINNVVKDEAFSIPKMQEYLDQILTMLDLTHYQGITIIEQDSPLYPSLLRSLIEKKVSKDKANSFNASSSSISSNNNSSLTQAQSFQNDSYAQSINFTQTPQQDVLLHTPLFEHIQCLSGEINAIAPLWLFVKGSPHAINLWQTNTNVAILGSHKINQTIDKVAQIICPPLIDSKFNIISGLNYGTQATVLKHTLANQGQAIAVLEHGFNAPFYSKEHYELAEQVLANNGLLISEYSLDVSESKKTLIESIRLQSSLAIASILLASALEGNSWHGLKRAYDNNRLIYAIDYKKHDSPLYQGNHCLIQENRNYQLTSLNLRSTLEQIYQYDLFLKDSLDIIS